MLAFRQWLDQVRYQYPNSLDVQRARSLQTFVRVTLPIAVILLLLTLLIAPPGAVLYSSCIFIIGYGVLILVVNYLLQTGRLYAGSIALIVVLAIGLLGLEAVSGLNVASTLNLSVALIIAGVLLNRRGLLVVVFLMVMGVLLIALANTTGVIVPRPPLNAPFLDVFIIAVTLGVDAGVFWIFIGAQTDANTRVSRDLHSLGGTLKISQALSNTFTVDELLTQVVEMVRDQFGYYHVQAFLIEPDSRLIVRRARTGAGVIQSSRERRIAPDDTDNVVVEAARTGQNVWVAVAAPKNRRTEFLPATHYELLIPLRSGQQTLGVLDVHNTSAESFSAAEVELLEGVAAQVTIALQNLQRYADLQTVSAERQRLQEQTIRLGREVERLSQEAAGRTWQRYLQNRSQDVLGFDWAAGKLTSSSTISPSVAQAFGNTEPEMRYEANEQILSVPILSRGQPLGVMEFRAPGSATWGARSIELSSLIAQRLSLALDNIRLFEQAQLTANREQTINRVAAQLQARTDLDSLLAEAAQMFSQALGATHTSIQIHVPEAADQAELLPSLLPSEEAS